MDLQIQPPLPQKRDFRIGILGSGFVTNEGHLPAYRKAGFNVVAIASRNRERAELTAKRHGIPKVHSSYEDLLNDPSIEVLVISLPLRVQLKMIVGACERKTVRGILAETPLDSDLDGAASVPGLCQQAGIVLSVSQPMRYEHSVRAAKTLLQNGAIGQPVFATIEMRGIPWWLPLRSELGWATLRRFSIHHLDCFRHWFGHPEGVYCSVSSDPRTELPNPDRVCTCILEYANGFRCVGIDDAWAGPTGEGGPTDVYLRWRIEGLNGLAIGEIGWGRDYLTKPSIIKFASRGDQSFHEPKWTEGWVPDAFSGAMAQLLIALETGTAPVLNPTENLKTMALVEAAHASTQRFVSISLADFKAPEILVPAVTKVVPKRETHRIQLPPKINKPGFFSQWFSKSTHTSVDPNQTAPSQNFTPRAQQVLALSRKEADRFNHPFVSTEHLLLGLIRLGQGVAVNVLNKLGLDLEHVRAAVEKIVGTGPDQKMIGNIPYTPRVKKVLALAAKEAKNLNHTYVGTEHILLGLLREGDGVAGRVLKNFGVDTERTRLEILKELDPGISPEIELTTPLSQLPSEASSPLASLVDEPSRPQFTPRAQQVLALARKEADRFNHNYVGTEHLLLGLIALGQGVAATVLRQLGLNLANVRVAVETAVGSGPDQKVIGDILYTRHVKKVLALAAREAKSLNHAYVGTESILLGLLREGDGVAARVFKDMNVDVEKTRLEILKELDPNFGEQT